MKSVASIIWSTIVFLALTVVTQTGGVIYLLVRVTLRRMDGLTRFIAFIAAYLFINFLITPHLASFYDRVALPTQGQAAVQPVNWFTVLCNRHYVDSELKATLMKTATELRAVHPESTVVYLDAGFPLFRRFPLIPHQSHNDGKKVDLAFAYADRDRGVPLSGSPSWTGYGVFEVAASGEVDTWSDCVRQGHSSYGYSRYFGWSFGKGHYAVDERRTRSLLSVLCNNPKVGRIFIEPHLKRRWGLSACQKIRFAGCQSVRHDDHIHIELR